ncbi:hypothetical protein M8C21_030179 [Ambrosia artemisiifolia]|uniref:UspA domain-containing protein n=1 Tax=Ambrosia artemisiifolia TaxID=4212 RepID=A0AAD5C0Y2_AMBAR|nr:hypothetical protein M8C21_030179 [Ambrosia artemisiifolia]
MGQASSQLCVKTSSMSPQRRGRMGEKQEQLRKVVVAVDGSEESMKGLQWALDNVRLHPTEGSLVIIHVQSPPSISAGLNPGSIPFGAGPSDVEVPAFTAAIEAHQRRITEAIITHAFNICQHNNYEGEVKTQVVIGDPKDKICEAVEDLHADLLVMGCRSFGPIKSFNGGFWMTYESINNLLYIVCTLQALLFSPNIRVSISVVFDV